jgi:hypothetical protein
MDPNKDNHILDDKTISAMAPPETPRHKATATAVPFWSDNPNILLTPKYIYELYPTADMTYDQKLNTISRLVLFVSLAGFLLSGGNIRILFVAAVTLLAIYLLHFYYVMTTNKHSNNKFRENMDSKIDTKAAVKQNLDALRSQQNLFDPPIATNPLSNVLLSDYLANPQKKPAAPADNENVAVDILSQAKETVKRLNPGQPDIADKLFGDLGEEYEFERSMQRFYSMPATTIPNDQGAFAEFCYGSMVSCKEGNQFACARNLPNYNLV